MKWILPAFLLLLLHVVTLETFSQSNDFLENKEFRNNYVSFALIKQDNVQTVSAANTEILLGEVLEDRSDISFVKTITDNRLKNGKRIQQDKYRLYKDGIEIYGSQYIFVSIDDTVKFVNGFFAPFSNENSDEQYSVIACRDLAIGYFNQFHQIGNIQSEKRGRVDTTILVYYYDQIQEKYRQAYLVQVKSLNSEYSEKIFVSTATGEFLGAESLICGANFLGTGETKYSGTRAIVTDAPSAAGPFRLQETRGPSNNVLIRTRNMNHQYDLSNVTDITDNDNNWTALEHGTNQWGLDAHWNAETVYDYWLNVHNRNSFNGNGMTIDSYIHLGTNLSNAYWHLNSIRYGDGVNGVNPFTVLDVTAHEFGHGVDLYTGDLLYEKESGALDEGFADIWSACVESWAKPAGNRWLLGEELFGGPSRSMSNPNAYSQPDTYLGTHWVSQVGCTPTWGNDYCGVHTNSGVLNFWFYLLTEGGTGVNDIGNSYNVAGIGIDKAQDIAYATKLLVGGTTNYMTCRSLSIQAATALYGSSSCEVKSVIDAWYAVGVGTNYIATLNLSISGPSQFCTTSSTYSINNLPSGFTVTWSVIPYMFGNWPPGNAAISSPNSPSTTLTKTADGVFTLRATISNVCGIGSIQLLKQVVVGPPLVTILGPYDPVEHTTMGMVCVNEEYYFIASDSESGQSYTWTLFPPPGSGEFPRLFSGTQVYIDFNVVGYHALRVSKTNSCGTTYTEIILNVQDLCPGGFSLIASPNPATSLVIVEIENETPQVRALSSNISVNLELFEYNTSSMKRRWNFPNTQNKFTLNVDGLNRGVYVLRVRKGRFVQSIKLIIN